jgi:hypothetical protein
VTRSQRMLRSPREPTESGDLPEFPGYFPVTALIRVFRLQEIPGYQLASSS